MDLRWMVVAIAGCVGLALCVAVALFRPVDTGRRRPLANVGRLTALPEYVRAIRRRALSTLVVVTLLVVTFAGAVLGGARPTGLPTAAGDSASAQPEDVMVCVGGSASDPAVTASLRFFATDVQTFGTERIGLTSANRRIVPLTRDYQYAAAQFGLAGQPDGAVDLVAPVSYVDYAEGVEDVLAQCISGFPGIDRREARRSVVYVGPDTLRPPGERRPALYDSARIRDMATAAGIQVNAVITGPGGTLVGLARDTGGRAFTGDTDVTASLQQIRDNPPAPSAVDADQVATQAAETPDVPVLVALLAAVALVGWLAVVRA